MEQKAFIEIDLPSSCLECQLVFMHEVEDSENPYNYGCGYINIDVTEYTDRRHEECPLKIKSLGAETPRLNEMDEAEKTETGRAYAQILQCVDWLLDGACEGGCSGYAKDRYDINKIDKATQGYIADMETIKAIVNKYNRERP